jgi:DNA-3-methyladenine glycosylase II
VTFTLEPVPPFRLDFTAWALRRRPANTIDLWDGETYRRVLMLCRRPVEVAVVARGARLEVTTQGDRAAVTRGLERLLGLRVNLAPFYEFAAAHPRLGPLAECFRGLKPPRFPTVFEALVNAITNQQISLTAGMTVLSRLAAVFGHFPLPEEASRLAPGEYRALGYSYAKARSVIANAAVDLESLDALDDEAALARLMALPGVGRWTAEYVLLRGLGRTHVFPGDDVGARALLERWLGRRKALDYEGVRRVLGPFRPYGGLLYLHLVLEGVAQAGHLPVAR